MNGEPQPQDVGDNLDRALFALKTVWFGLFSGGVVIAVMMTAIVFSSDVPIADLGDLGYLFLLAVPMGLVAAYVLAPMATPKDPAAVVRSAAGKSAAMYEGWSGTRPDDPYYWFPAYTSQFFVKAGMLEGSSILCSLGFLITANWFVLGGALVLIAALVVEIPTRVAAESFAASARNRQANAR